MIEALLIGLLLTVLTVSIHAAGTSAWISHLSKQKPLQAKQLSGVQGVWILSSTAATVLLLVFSEVILWAVAYRFLWGELSIATFEESVYFSAVTFTSLGYGDVVLTGDGRLLSAVEAVAGLLIFGWSTALFFAVVQAVWQARGIYISNDDPEERSHAFKADRRTRQEKAPIKRR